MVSLAGLHDYAEATTDCSSLRVLYLEYPRLLLVLLDPAEDTSQLLRFENGWIVSSIFREGTDGTG